MPGIPIDAIPQLNAFRGRLGELGYRTLQHFLGAAHASPEAMGRFLGTDLDALLALLGAEYLPLVRLAAGQAVEHPRRALGAMLGQRPQPRMAFALSKGAAAPVPASVNLTSQMPAIRDQGNDRGCCVAFASLAVFEHYLGQHGDVVDLAEQYLYCDCKSHDGHPQEYGTWIDVAFERLNVDGCCTEAAWPYVSAVIPGDEGQCPPPAGAAAEASRHKVGVTNALPPTSVPHLKAELARGRCVAFSVPVFDSWYRNNPGVERSGDIMMPFPGERGDGGHAMCIVGYRDDAAEEAIGGGRFLLRNSWGSTWGTENPNGPGYGTIPYAYLTQYGKEAYSVY